MYASLCLAFIAKRISINPCWSPLACDSGAKASFTSENRIWGETTNSVKSDNKNTQAFERGSGFNEGDPFPEEDPFNEEKKEKASTAIKASVHKSVIAKMRTIISETVNSVKSAYKKTQKYEFVVGFKEGVNQSRPFASFHNSLIMRGFRVLGGIAMAISIVLYKVHPTLFEQYIAPSFVLPIFGFALIFATYTIVYSLITFFFTLYLIVTGKWLVRNSPVRWLLSSGRLVGFCYNNMCTTVITVGAVGTAAVTVDTIIDWTNDEDLHSYRPKMVVQNVWGLLKPGSVVNSSSLIPLNIVDSALAKENQRLTQLFAEMVDKKEHLAVQEELKKLRDENLNLNKELYKNKQLFDTMAQKSSVIKTLLNTKD